MPTDAPHNPNEGHTVPFSFLIRLLSMILHLTLVGVRKSDIMVLLHLVLGLFLVLGLSNCDLVFHEDCDANGSTLSLDHLLNCSATEHRAVRRIMQTKFGKAKDRILAVSQEMMPLRNVATAKVG